VARDPNGSRPARSAGWSSAVHRQRFAWPPGQTDRASCFTRVSDRMCRSSRTVHSSAKPAQTCSCVAGPLSSTLGQGRLDHLFLLILQSVSERTRPIRAERRLAREPRLVDRKRLAAAEDDRSLDVAHSTLSRSETFIPHNRCHTRGATIAGEPIDREIVGPTSVPAGAHVPARCHLGEPLSPALCCKATTPRPSVFSNAS
jgi:hypothetical protein